MAEVQAADPPWPISSSKAFENPDQDQIKQKGPPKKSGNRISRLLKRSKAAISRPAEDSSKDAPSNQSNQKRRQQVYQAQKRHRNRQAEYVSSLEAEIAQLQHLDSVAHAEMNALAHENQKMRQLLASMSIDHQLESMSLAPTLIATDDMSQLGSAAIEIRFDPIVGHERTFVDVSDQFNFNDGSGVEPSVTKQNSSEGDSWAALDFILSLEHCCQNHTYHSGVNPTAHKCDYEGSTGHALSMSAAVYQSAVPPMSSEDPEDTELYGGIRSKPQPGKDGWQLPHSEIEKLVTMSEQLPIDDSEMTPAQAYAAIRESVPDTTYLKPVMEALKVLLCSHMACFGFGAVMPAVVFWEHLDTVLKTLGLDAAES